MSFQLASWLVLVTQHRFGETQRDKYNAKVSIIADVTVTHAMLSGGLFLERNLTYSVNKYLITVSGFVQAKYWEHCI